MSGFEGSEAVRQRVRALAEQRHSRPFIHRQSRYLPGLGIDVFATICSLAVQFIFDLPSCLLSLVAGVNDTGGCIGREDPAIVAFHGGLDGLPLNPCWEGEIPGGRGHLWKLGLLLLGICCFVFSSSRLKTGIII